MLEAIHKFHEVEPALRRFEQEAAFVEGAEAEGWRVRSGSGSWLATRATSCLVEPRGGDKVLLAVSTDHQEVFVLSILSRAERGTATELKVEGDLQIHASGGELELSAASGIRMLTPEQIEAVAQRFKLQAEDAKFFVKSLAYLGRELVGRVQVAKVAGDVMDGAWSSVRQHAKRFYRTATEGEYVRAGNMDVRCDKTLMLHGDNASVTAKKLIKMDSAQILMG